MTGRRLPARASWVLQRCAAAGSRPAVPAELRAAVPRASRTIAVTLLWVIGSVLPMLVILAVGAALVLGAKAESRWLLVPLLGCWIAVAGAASLAYVRLIGSVDEVRAVRPRPRALHHLPAACARLVEEAAAIREDLGDVEAALQRAWELANALERAPGEVQQVLEGTGATLQPVRALIEARAGAGRSRLPRARVREQLTKALASFEAALERPRAGGFR